LAAQERGELVQLIAWYGDAPVGRGHVLFPGHRQWSISAHRERCAEVRDVWVAPGRRRTGVATAIMRTCEEVVRGRGLARVGLSVALDEDAVPARALYEWLGYRTAHGPYVGTTRIDTDAGPKPVGAVFLYLVKEL
jgi:GNAT superfamily N-acetyltransferase